MIIRCAIWLSSFSLHFDCTKYKSTFTYSSSSKISNQIFHYTCCITLKRLTSLLAIFPVMRPDNTALLEEMSQRWRAVGNSTVCSIWPARDLNLISTAPETKGLTLDHPCEVSLMRPNMRDLKNSKRAFFEKHSRRVVMTWRRFAWSVWP